MSTAGADRQTRELMIALLSWLAKWESERKSERLKATVRTRRNRAASLGQRAKWGGREGSQLASDADVGRVRELRRAGKSVRAIAADVGLSKSQVGRMLAGRAA